MSQFIYLHGFASGSGSSKARFLRERWQRFGIDLQVPDLSPCPFESLTLSAQLDLLDRTVGGRSAVLIGSSMGGYLAALYGAGHPEVEKVVLLAPAFRFAARWAERLGPDEMEKWRESGFLSIFHYGEGRPASVGYQLYQDALQYPDFPCVKQPCLIIHGSNDQIVPVQYSVEFERQCPGTKLLVRDDDHELRGALDDVARAIEGFLGLC